MLSLLLLLASPAEAALPPLHFATKKVHCVLQWASATAYSPKIAEATLTLQLRPIEEGSQFYLQEFVRNTSSHAGPPWNGGIEAAEHSDGSLYFGIYLRKNEPDSDGQHPVLMGSDQLIPARAAQIPRVTLTARVPPEYETHGPERSFTHVEFSCQSVK